MDKPTFEKYVEERYRHQMNFYDKSSTRNQRKYKQFQWILIILSAITPVLAALDGKIFKMNGTTISFANIQIFVVVISAIVAILTTSLKTFNYQELWVNYRNTNERLKPEIYYYHFNIGPYGESGIDKESLFVTRIEAILDAEHKLWPPAKQMQEDQEKAGDGGSSGGDQSDAANDTKEKKIMQQITVAL